MPSDREIMRVPEKSNRKERKNHDPRANDRAKSDLIVDECDSIDGSFMEHYHR